MEERKEEKEQVLLILRLIAEQEQGMQLIREEETLGDLMVEALEISNYFYKV